MLTTEKQPLAAGAVSKMRVRATDDGLVSYQLQLGDQTVAMNDLLGQSIHLHWHGEIHCDSCGRKTKKSFGQGHCYPCFSKLAQCDPCMMSPEKCHFHLGTCREPEWAESVCFQSHYVYLANSSGLKVGITRATQLPTRWIDQGAIQGMAIAKVKSRRIAGLVEDLLRGSVADKTNWRTMLKGTTDIIDLNAQRDALFEQYQQELSAISEQFDDDSGPAIEPLIATNSLSQTFHYPVLEYPTKISSHNLDKNPDVQGRLMGIKGQYLMLDTGVINLRKYTSYRVSLFGDNG